MTTQGIGSNNSPGEEPSRDSHKIELLASNVLPTHLGRGSRVELESPPKGDVTSDEVDSAAGRLMESLIGRLLPELQRHLSALEGLNLGTKENARLAKNLTRLLRGLGCCVACQTCGEPAVALRYVDMYKGGSWVWRFEHTPSKRHGGTVKVPALELVVKPTKSHD